MCALLQSCRGPLRPPAVAALSRGVAGLLGPGARSTSQHSLPALHFSVFQVEVDFLLSFSAPFILGVLETVNPRSEKTVER